MKSRLLISVIAATLMLPVLATPADAAGSPVRLGNNTEGIALIANGQHAGKMAVLDGYDVFAITINGPSRPLEPLFNVQSVGWVAFPSGIAYLAPEKRYAFTDQGDTDVLVVTDTSGHLQSVRPITYLPGSLPVIATEGLTYLGDDSVYPDRLARAVYLADFSPSIQILDRQGTVEREIAVTGLPEDEDNYLAGIASQPGGAFLGSTLAGIWRISADGAVVGAPTPVPSAGWLEGMATAPGKRVYGAGYSLGTLLGFDRALRRDPGLDRGFPIGIGFSRSFNGFWDSVTGRYVALGIDRFGMANDVAALPPDLSSKQVLFTIPGFPVGLGAGPGATIATCSDTGGIDEYNRDGTLSAHIDFPASLTRPCHSLAYLSSQDAYVVALRSVANRFRIFEVSRAGGLLMTIPTAPVPVASVAVAPDDPATILVWGAAEWAPWTLQRYDAATGALEGSSTPDTGSMNFPFGYLAGLAGSYALLDPDVSGILIFGA